MSKKPVHVTPRGDDWQVIRSGSDRASAVTSTQGDAIEIGRGIARNQDTELFIHGRDGRIRDRDSYGNDPCPPKDTKH